MLLPWKQPQSSPFQYASSCPSTVFQSEFAWSFWCKTRICLWADEMGRGWLRSRPSSLAQFSKGATWTYRRWGEGCCACVWAVLWVCLPFLLGLDLYYHPTLPLHLQTLHLPNLLPCSPKCYRSEFRPPFLSFLLNSLKTGHCVHPSCPWRLFSGLSHWSWKVLWYSPWVAVTEQ